MHEKMVLAGCDEAGRGCVIGPLVIAGVSIDEDKEHLLKKMGCRDSKMLKPARRVKIAQCIEKTANDIIVLKVAPCKIDSYRSTGINLNRLEAMKFAEAINYLGPRKVYIDSPDVNTGRLKAFMAKMVQDGTELIVEHKADFNYPVVSAASIIAKVERDEDIAKLREKYGDFGSGYSSDERTTKWMGDWLQNNKQFPDCVRRSWDTTGVALANRLQTKLTGWLKRK